MRFVIIFMLNLLYLCIIDLLSEILFESSYIQIYFDSFSAKEWKMILLAITVLVLAVISVITTLKNMRYYNKMIIMEECKYKKINIKIKILIILCCLGIYIYYKSVSSLMVSFVLVLFAIIVFSRELIKDGIIEEGIIYERHLIKWEDIISYEWDKLTLKMIVSTKFFRFKLKDKITIEVKDDAVWKKYIGGD